MNEDQNDIVNNASTDTNEDELASALQAEVDAGFEQDSQKNQAAIEEAEASLERVNAIAKDVNDGEERIDAALSELDGADARAEEKLDTLMSKHISEMANQEQEDAAEETDEGANNPAEPAEGNLSTPAE